MFGVPLKWVLWLIGVPALLGTALTLYSVVIEPSRLVVQRYEVGASGGDTLRVALIADLHVGSPMAGLGKVQRVVDRVIAEEPDLILHLGDFLVSGVLLGTFVEPEHIADVLTGLEAPLGVYAVLGNHDWWEDGPGMEAALEAAGIEVLENESVELPGGLWVVGVADDTTRDPNFDVAFEDVPEGAPSILIGHDPGAYLDYTHPAQPMFMAAGHTHGGQIYLPWLFDPVVPGRAGPDWAHGLLDAGGVPLIVSSGIGTSILPVRLGRPPEIVIVEVTLS